ncbi:MAG: aminotransferase class I/II-fold pyridoxal phosphate-dependent enzyme [Clostridia bacterium]|nr:aminotransferase class I/II-fold pyridoxal phosphate-dependent enzyme [Clostridia bacterium]MBO5785756.1 aminotransferase class I/II-fold pyridoxal phosphate-dependent enzyme [Clostridia bacterium]MBO5914380.1 aminotransferase class I/II-fold pyridoxal phosphate-dependent enzyme [Clostridia bacterium]
MKDVVGLTVGQPDFDTPWHIRNAGIRSLEEGHTYYTSNNGIMEMREEIANYQKRRFGLEYDAATEIIVTVGGSEAIDLALRALIEPGDEVIIPQPCFVCYEPLARLAGAVPITLDLSADNGFRLTADQLRSAITEKTKMLILAFPNNPTGSVLRRKDLEEIAEVLRETNIVVLSDEIYAELTYGEKHISIASLEGMRERTIIANGFSKSYAMTGWRMGYTLAPKYFTEQMAKIHQYGIMSAPTTSQYASIEALKNGDADIEYMKAEYEARRRLIVSELNRIGIETFMPDGAFYVFADLRKFGIDDETFCERLLYEHKCAIVPGSAFGESGRGFARLSYAYSPAHIHKAIARIEEFIKTL